MCLFLLCRSPPQCLWKEQFITEPRTIPRPYHSVGFVLSPAFSLLFINEQATTPIVDFNLFPRISHKVNTTIRPSMLANALCVALESSSLVYLWRSLTYSGGQCGITLHFITRCQNQSRFVLSTERKCDKENQKFRLQLMLSAASR